MVLSNNIRYLRKSRGWSQDHLAELLGYKSFTTIQKWETGVSEPPLKKAHALADLFGVDIDVLTKVDIEHEPTPPTPDPIPPGFQPLPSMRKVPLIGHIACGQPITAEENVEELVDAPVAVNCDFALRCEGDSMIDAGISDGDVVFIRSQPEVHNGQIAAVRISDEATLKRVYWDGNVLMLIAENRSFPPMQFSGQELEQVHIEGLAVGFLHWF